MNIQGKTAAEIVDCVRALVQAGQAVAGDALPPVRELALALGVNRNTVAAAYRRLVTTGIALAEGRRGTLIRDRFAAGEQEGATAGTPLLDLASGNPNPRWLPDLAASLKAGAGRPRMYGEPTVNAALERHIRGWLTPDCPAGFEIDLTHGAVDALERLLAMDLLAGDLVAVEDPCFLSSIQLLRNARLQAVGVRVDAEGMVAAELEAALARGAQAVIITPRAHNPTGCSLSARRARSLARVLARYPNVLVVVDDHFSLLSGAAYHSVIPRAARRWALVRSLSKTLGPDIRLAAVASDAATSRQLRRRLAPGTAWVSHLLQDIAEAALASPANLALFAQARDDYLRRRSHLEAALRAHGVDHVASGDGLNLWIPLQAGDDVVAQSLARQGWLVRHGDGFAVQGEARGLRITISTIDAAQCEQLARDIALQLRPGPATRDGAGKQCAPAV